MGSGVFGVALSGLNAAQSGLLTTSHNVANASTPGYNRQEIRQEASKPQFTILVILDNPSKYTFGGTAAAPAFRQIAENLLTLKGVQPDQLDFIN